MPGFYPDEDEDPWKALLGPDPLGVSEPMPAMLQDPSAQAMAREPIPQMDPEHEAYSALAGVGQPPELSGDNDVMRKAVMALAMMADLAMNKGRTMGPLMAAGLAPAPDVEHVNYQRRMQDAKDRASIEHQLRMGQGSHLSPEEAALRARGLDLEADRIRLGREQIAARGNGVVGAREAAIALGADPAQLEGMTDQQVAAWKSAITAQMRQGGSNEAWEHRNDVRVGNQIAAEGRRPEVAAATTAATTTARLNATNGTPDEAMTNFEAANPKLQVTDPGTFRALGSNPRTAAQRQQQLMNATRALDASARLRELDAAYAAIPLPERLSDAARAMASEYEQLVNEHQGIIQKIAQSGSGSVNEREVIREGIPSIYNPLAAARLQGVEKMLHLNVGANLAPYGIGIRGEGDPVPRATRQQGPDRHDPGAFIPPSGHYLPIGNEKKRSSFDIASEYGWTQ